MALGALVGSLVVAEPRSVRSALLYPLRDLLGFCYWVASYVSNQVRWRGEVYNLLQDGFMRNDSQARRARARSYSYGVIQSAP